MNEHDENLKIVKKANVVVQILTPEKVDRIRELLPSLANIETVNEFVEIALEKFIKALEESVDQLNEQFKFSLEDLVIEETVEFTIKTEPKIEDLDFRIYPLDDKIYTVDEDD